MPGFLVRSDTRSVPPVMNKILLIKAGGKTSHVAMDVIKDHRDSASAWSLDHHTAASGHNFQAFSLQKPATIAHLQKMLTKRCCSATAGVISRCFNKFEIRAALKLKKTPRRQMAWTPIRQKESRQRAMAIKVLMECDGRRPSKALTNQHDVSQAAALHASKKTSDMSQLEIRRNAVRIIETNEHLSLDEEQLLENAVERQRSLKAASRAYDDDGGSDVKRQLVMASREKEGSINRPQEKMKAARDGDKKDFSWKTITKQAEFRRPEGGSETEQSHIENGNQDRLTYIRQADFTRRADNNDVNHKQMLTEVGEGVLIMLFLSNTDKETQTEPSWQRKLLLNANTGWKTAPITQTDDPLATSKVKKEIFVIGPHNSKCICLKGIPLSLEIYAVDRTERMDLKPAESAAEATTVSAFTEQVKDRTDSTETNSAPENMSINQTKQEENVPSDDSVIPSPPSLQMMETETTKTESTSETTTVNMEIKETTSSMGVFNRGSRQTGDGLPSAEETATTTASPNAEPGSTRCKTHNNTQATAEKSLSGLRMREDVPADTSKLQEDSENEGRAAASRPGDERREDEDDPKVNSFTFAKPSQAIRQQAAGELPKVSEAAGPDVCPD